MITHNTSKDMGMFTPKSLRRWPATLSIFLLAVAWLAACSGNPASTPTAQKSATPSSTHGTPAQPTPVPTLSLEVDHYIKGMSLDARIGQLLMLQFTTVGYVGDSITMMREFQPGALILYKYEMPDAASVRDMTSRAQKDAHIPLFIAVDQEGGAIDQLVHIYGQRPSATGIGETNDPSFAYQQGVQNAKDMASLGLNMDLAPDVDVQLVDGPDQSSRTFGSTPQQVTKMAGAFLDGLQSAGVVGAIKHFPGLGAATTDAHLSLPVINRTRSEIEQVELAPYRNLINSEDPPAMIMSTDLLMPAIDPTLPAEISPPTITGILRDELHYDGVVVTDALYMDGIAKNFDQYQAGVMALKAGCDMLLGPANVASAQAMVDAIKGALQNGTLTEARINQSVHRILLLKAEHGMLTFPHQTPPATPTPHLLSVLAPPPEHD
jgi:beta-N-acetylhexosaminidase